MAELKRQLESEIEELKQSHEADLVQLREKMRKEKHSSSAAVSEQVGLG